MKKEKAEKKEKIEKKERTAEKEKNGLQSDPSEYMIEKIKQRPINKRKLLRRSLITVCMAVLFGLVACFTFLVLEPLFTRLLYPEEPPATVTFPEETDEMKPEDMLTTEEDKKNTETELIPEDQIEEIFSGVVLDIEHCDQLYDAVNRYVEELRTTMVTVTGIVSEKDWFNNPYETKGQDSGIIIADNGQEILILTDYMSIRKPNQIQVTFHDGTQAEAQIKQIDNRTELVVISVPKEGIPEETLKNLKIAVLGSSIRDVRPGEPVVALGSPMGGNGSVNYGIVTTAPEPVNIIDFDYKLFMTNMYASVSAKGVLFNLQGEVVGIIENDRNKPDMKNIICALGISDLKKTIAKMSNKEPVPYFGIYGTHVTNKAHDKLGVPYGAYVNQVAIDSPAMKAGIQCGDVIVHLGSETVLSYEDYVAALLRNKVGNNIEVDIMRQVQDDYKKMTLTLTLETLE